MPTSKKAALAVVTGAVLALAVGMAPVRAGQDPAQVAEGPTLIQGHLIDVDPVGKTLSVQAPDGTRAEFRFTRYTVVSGATRGIAGLGTREGDHALVTVTFTEIPKIRDEADAWDAAHGVMLESEKIATRIDVEPRLLTLGSRWREQRGTGSGTLNIFVGWKDSPESLMPEPSS